MIDSLPFILLLSTGLGFLSGLGIGGGSLLILWLTLVLDMPQETARIMNLLFFLPSALVACFFRLKQGSVSFRKIIPAIIGGCISAGIISWIIRGADTRFLQKCFGILLILTGIREITYKAKETGS